MSRRRRDIGYTAEKAIRAQLSEGGSVLGISLKYSCSQGLIRTIRDGTRNNEFLDTPPQKQIMCTACGTRPKAPELTYLCQVCFKEEGE
ncbi:hypothetical protein LCGC14_2276310 [marine sediment metagenome]|uniref:Uncharacterized protein n=1 Tax=marine sediment metagenome TaxID=412755 RepID=A0A0F9CVH9_9ZZZZ